MDRTESDPLTKSGALKNNDAEKNDGTGQHSTGQHSTGQHDNGSRTLIRGTAIVSALTLVSRLFGFVRDLLVAGIFGAGALADCFFVAFKIPNLLRSFVAEGALTSAFVPIFTSELKQSKENAQRAISSVLVFLLIITGLMSLLGIIFAGEVVRAIAPGFSRDQNTFELCVLLTRIMLPYIIFISLVAMLGAALNSVKIFGAAAFAQVLMNITLIAGALIAALFDPRSGVIILAVSVIAGGIVQVIAQFPPLRKAGFNLKPHWGIFSPQIKQLLILMLPATLGATVYQISQFINTLLASLLVAGSVSWLFYADRLTQLPLGIFSIALASVLLPSLSHARAGNDDISFSKNLIDSMRYTSFFIVPISFLIFYFARTIIGWMFERGAFSSHSGDQTALAVKAFALGLWAVSCHSMVVRAFIARRDTVTPTLIGIASLALNLVLSLLLMGPISEENESRMAEIFRTIQTMIGSIFPSADFAHSGLALAASISSGFALLCSVLILKRRVATLDLSMFISASARAILCSLAATAAVEFLMRPLFPQTAVTMIFMILAWVLVFLAAALVSGTTEARQSLELFREKISSRLKG